MNTWLTVDTIKKGKLYSKLRDKERKYGRMKSEYENRIRQLEIENCFLKRELEK